MIGDLCQMLRNQNFAGLKGVYGRRADMDTPKPYATVTRFGGDRNGDLSGNDGSLIFTDVQIKVYSSKPNTDAAIAEQIAIFLEQAIDVTMGGRILYGCQVEEPTDFDESPIDGSDNWNGGTQVTARLEHN